MYKGFCARESCLLPWKLIKKIEDSSFQIFTGVSVTYRFSRDSPNFPKIGESIPPDPINHVCSLTGKKISGEYFTYLPVQIFKIMFQRFLFSRI